MGVILTNKKVISFNPELWKSLDYLERQGGKMNLVGLINMKLFIPRAESITGSF